MFPIITAPPATQERSSCWPVCLIVSFILSYSNTILPYSATLPYNTWYIYKALIMSHSITPNENYWFTSEILHSDLLRARPTDVWMKWFILVLVITGVNQSSTLHHDSHSQASHGIIYFLLFLLTHLMLVLVDWEFRLCRIIAGHVVSHTS